MWKHNKVEFVPKYNSGMHGLFHLTLPKFHWWLKGLLIYLLADKVWIYVLLQLKRQECYGLSDWATQPENHGEILQRGRMQ